MDPRESSKPKVLAADDNEQNRALVQAVLEAEGYEVVLANDGEQAAILFEREKPQCVLLDIRMPNVDGFAACERIRALPGGAETPILFLTALREVDAFDTALRAGADDFLTKPIRPTELVVRVQTALRLSRLGHELKSHVEFIRKQRDDMVRLQLQKERLMNFVVHDLKNPVNSIDLQAQVLIRSKDLPAVTRERAEHIRADARNLLRLILNLLDISKSEEGQLAPQPASVDLPELVNDVMSAMEVHARANNLKLVTKTSEPREVHADPDLLRRVLENLLDNAIRHTPEGGEVTIASSLEDDHVDIRVKDTGAGIPSELRERIFEKYIQAESKNSAMTRTGRGLGLAFCRLAIEAHGGSIHVESTGYGTTFCVKLPHAQ